MKPICPFIASGTPISAVMNSMTATISALLKDRPFRYLDTVVVPEATALGGISYTVTMIFEAETQQDIDSLQEDQKVPAGSAILKPV